jgi:demethylmenaquinone methyltransferase/2-methoxy-6-polyprenyl-1,4-benzoquinol methylase
MSDPDSTHFGFQEVPEDQKAYRVGAVFDSVASRYDVMNDLMSAGLHRVWKAFSIAQAAVRPGMKVLDVAGGTADLSREFARRAGPGGEVWLTDINASMLRIGRDRMLDDGLVQPALQCDAEHLPFPDAYVDRVMAFGLRNMTHRTRRSPRWRGAQRRQAAGARVLAV